jgi:hypothetical protein
MTIIDPTADTGIEWVERYGNPESVRFTAASVLSSYDYLLSGNISLKEASRRLALLRRARAALTEPLAPAPGGAGGGGGSAER